MRKVWIVVANRAEAKIYRAENVSTLVEHTSLKHGEGSMHQRELSSDKQGSIRGKFGTDTMEEKTSPKSKEANHFAAQIALVLEKGLQAKEVERIYLIAKAPFIGVLHQVFKPAVAKCIEKEVHKDLLHASKEQLREYLPPVL